MNNHHGQLHAVTGGSIDGRKAQLQEIDDQVCKQRREHAHLVMWCDVEGQAVRDVVTFFHGDQGRALTDHEMALARMAVQAGMTRLAAREGMRS